MAGNPHPITGITGISTTANVSKSAFISYAKSRAILVMQSATEIRATDLSGQLRLTLFSTGMEYELDVTDTTTPDNGVTCIRDANGLGFFLIVNRREKLTTTRNYYVRTDGDDLNSGLINNAGGAFLTLQRAYDIVKDTLDFGGQIVVINVSAGTYAAGVNVSGGWTGGGTLYFSGDTTTPANVHISMTTGLASCFYVSAPLPGTLRIQGFKVSSTVVSSSGIRVDTPGLIHVGKMEFGSCTFAHIYINSVAVWILRVAGGSTIVGSALYHVFVGATGSLYSNTLGASLSGTLTFSFFALVLNAGQIIDQSTPYTGGTITGARYHAAQNGIINTAGGGANWFPGNAAGSVATQGQYL